jgi:hypothetical protein
LKHYIYNKEAEKVIFKHFPAIQPIKGDMSYEETDPFYFAGIPHSNFCNSNPCGDDASGPEQSQNCGKKDFLHKQSETDSDGQHHICGGQPGYLRSANFQKLQFPAAMESAPDGGRISADQQNGQHMVQVQSRTVLSCDPKTAAISGRGLRQPLLLHLRND